MALWWGHPGRMKIGGGGGSVTGNTFDDTLDIAYDYFHDPEGESFDDGETGSYADMTVPKRTLSRP